MKKCPFCAEEIQDEAIKCKHCGEFLDETINPVLAGKKTPWYFRTSIIVVAFFCVGPFALPLIWVHPKITRPWKIGLTIVILIVSWFLFQTTVKSIGIIREYYELLDEL